MPASRPWRAPSRAPALLLLAGLAACTARPAMQAPITPLPEPIADLPPYRLQVGDDLMVKFLFNPELNEQVTVRPDGRISTGAAQDVVAYGRTPAELADTLRGLYAGVLKQPTLSVLVQAIAPSRIYVGGEVANPGEFVTVGPNLTLTQALARAGGVRFSAANSRIFIIRRGVGDHPQLLATRYRDVIRAHDASADVRLATYDVVYVPRTGVGELYAFYNQYIQQFANVNWGFSYLLNQSSNNVVTK